MLNCGRLTIIVLTAALFYGCDNEVEFPTDPKTFANPSRELDGKYEVVSLISEKPVDLDRDGNFSTDILKETNLQIDSLKYFTTLTTIKRPGDDEIYYQQLYMWVPLTGVYSDDKGNYLSTGYSFAGLYTYYRYYPDTKEIKLVDHGFNNNGTILNIELVKGELLITFDGFYYTNDWEELIIKGTYRRRI